MAEDSGTTTQRRRPQPTVLVTGSTDRVIRDVPLRLFEEAVHEDDGFLLVSTSEEPRVLADRVIGAVDCLTFDDFGIVDCTPSQNGHVETGRTGDQFWRVSSPVDFTRTADSIWECFDVLEERTTGQTHVLFDSLSTQFSLGESSAVVQNAHQLAVKLGGKNGLGVFPVETNVVSGQDVERLKHLFDIHVEVRKRDHETQVKWSGVVGSSDGWVKLKESDPGYGVFGIHP